MKKILSVFLVMMLLVTAVSASPSGASKGNVPKIGEGIIVVDGAKDEIYDQALTVDITQLLQGDENGAWAKAYMLWAEGAFYFLAEVTDPVISIPSADIQNSVPWESDSVEMFFDFGNEHLDLAQQFRLDVTGFPSYYSEGGADSAYGPEAAAPYFDEYAATMTDVGYNIEMRVDLEKYYLSEGQAIGMQLQVNDRIADNVSNSVKNMVSSQNAGSWDVDLYDYVILGPELVIETEAEVVDAPADAADVAAPQTFDGGILAAVSAILAAAGYMVSKKNK